MAQILIYIHMSYMFTCDAVPGLMHKSGPNESIFEVCQKGQVNIQGGPHCHSI